jgi:2-dehydro-3-deoxyphosphooctonate aldolase (KDO 8-P synthase)
LLKKNHRRGKSQRFVTRTRRVVWLQHARVGHACSPSLKQTTQAPVIFDATHWVQQPGGKGTSSGGEREFVSVLARAATAVGIAGIFVETHQDPDKAPSDGPNMLPVSEMEPLLRRLIELDRLSKS